MEDNTKSKTNSKVGHTQKKQSIIRKTTKKKAISYGRQTQKERMEIEVYFQLSPFYIMARAYSSIFVIFLSMP